MKKYILLDKNGCKYESDTPGKFGGYSRKKIYGRWGDDEEWQTRKP